MAMLDDILKGYMLTAVAVGLGAVLLAPLAGPVLRPAAKAAIKGGILAYQGGPSSVKRWAILSPRRKLNWRPRLMYPLLPRRKQAGLDSLPTKPVDNLVQETNPQPTAAFGCLPLG